MCLYSKIIMKGEKKTETLHGVNIIKYIDTDRTINPFCQSDLINEFLFLLLCAATTEKGVK